MSTWAATTETCLSTIKRLYELREKYKDAPAVIVAICSALNDISLSLTKIQGRLQQLQHLSEGWRPHPALSQVIDTALTGVSLIFSSIDAEIQRITAAGRSNSSWIRPWRLRLRMIRSESRWNDLLGLIHSQQRFLILSIDLLQT